MKTTSMFVPSTCSSALRPATLREICVARGSTAWMVAFSFSSACNATTTQSPALGSSVGAESCSNLPVICAINSESVVKTL